MMDERTMEFRSGSNGRISPTARRVLLRETYAAMGEQFDRLREYLADESLTRRRLRRLALRTPVQECAFEVRR